MDEGGVKTERSLFALPCILVLTNCFLSGIVVYGMGRGRGKVNTLSRSELFQLSSVCGMEYSNYEIPR